MHARLLHPCLLVFCWELDIGRGGRIYSIEIVGHDKSGCFSLSEGSVGEPGHTPLVPRV